MTTQLVVRGARQHNLKNVDVSFPRDRLVVITGPSGSGKSTLAFDTIYAEGQRRYVESLSAYARQFLDQMPKPDVDSIEGLSPAISIEQRTTSRNPRSTVGTVTEIHDYLRLLYARAGQPHCPVCGREVRAHTIQQMVDWALGLPENARLTVQAPVVRGVVGDHADTLRQLRKDGYVRVTIDGTLRDLGEDLRLAPKAKHDIEVHVDRIVVRSGARQRLTESVELAAKLAGGVVRIAPADGESVLFSERLACPVCDLVLPEITPRTFSFNSPDGACARCGGIGVVRHFETDLVVPDATLSLEKGAIAPWGKADGPYARMMVAALLAKVRVDPRVAWSALPAATRTLILEGGPANAGDGKKRKKSAEAEDVPSAWEGVIPGLERRSREYERRKREAGADEEGALEYLDEEFHRYARSETCPACKGARLRPEALAVTVGARRIHELLAMSLKEALAFLRALRMPTREAAVSERIVREVVARLALLADLGLDYLSLDRAAASLSGGEAERIRLATQIGAALVGVLYVLDEPSVGLHPRDNERLIRTLVALRDLGNTVLVVEHDADTILAADHVIDMGPAAGKHGGTVVAQGTPEEIARNPRSVTGQFLSGARSIAVPTHRRKPTAFVTVRDAKAHNLRNVTVRFPLGVLTAVTGVSGSGKSTLVVDTLLAAARAELNGARLDEPIHAQLEGLAQLDKVIAIDQSPIGRSPRSSPATYTEVFGPIRDLFAGLPDSRARGYKPGRFSTNVKGGRCEACLGAGVMRIEMHFLPDVFVTCEACHGTGYNRETLEVRYRGVNIAELLKMPVDDAHDFLSAVPKVREKLAALRSVGLGYLELGQPSNTLSGGEAQRVKLARELARRATGRTLYVLDEPTTGLHFGDVEQLVGVLHALVDAGNSVVVIEHNLDVIKVADHVIDIGPEGGTGGGTLVAEGTPEEVARQKASHTGRFLAKVLAPPKTPSSAARAARA